MFEWRNRPPMAVIRVSFTRFGELSIMSRVRVSGGRSTAARVITGVGAVIALIEVIYILMILLGANATNAFVEFMRAIAEPLALFFPGLFQLENYQVGVLINYGLAAVFWLVLTGLIARIVR
ncbi:hypothetical protein [Amycolatopsis magusensis]|uniref:hypothetical protein n=1 Tax=Amycolatopsis magusensis TaxID=882444 RepID=UPI0024A805BD|nr:hypothetical protein [Amycolatopsis magusensis]MDI5980407.1 hypothetical protein [Amycolatopsis magusensis]